MFEGLRDRRGSRAQETLGTAQAAALARRQMRQPGRHSDGEAGAVPPESAQTTKDGISAAGQLAMVARHAASVSRPPRDGREAADGATFGQTLTVGAGIQLKGEITNCQTLIVEGHVEGSAASGMLQIAEGGAFVGQADIDTAVVSGRFEGALTAATRLIIRASGRVSGTIRYAAIAIEAGGQISGDVEVTASAVAVAPAAPAEAPKTSDKAAQIDIAS